MTQDIKSIKDDVYKYFKSQNWSTSSIENHFKKFNEGNQRDNLLERCIELHGGRGMTLRRMHLWYGKELGDIKWKKYCDRQAYTNSQAYKGMSDNEFELYNKSRAVTIENLIRKYGESEGTRRFNEYRKKQVYTKSTQYYIDLYGERGIDIAKSVNTSKANTLDNFVKRHGNDGIGMYLEYMSNRPTYYSQIATNMFAEINKYIDNVKMYYAPKTREFSIFSKEHNKIYFYDCVIPDAKICIEFNGDCFHANPKIYSSNDHPNPFNKDLTSNDIWLHDKCKCDTIVARGFKMITVWESDYRTNRNDIITNLVNTIKESL